MTSSLLVGLVAQDLCEVAGTNDQWGLLVLPVILQGYEKPFSLVIFIMIKK